MSRYTVCWLQGAQNHLAQIWVDAPNKQAVTAAANAIDAELTVDAESKGIPVSEGLRSFAVPPLHVLFRVREPDRLVEVASVRIDPSPSAGTQTNGQPKPTT